MESATRLIDSGFLPATELHMDETEFENFLNYLKTLSPKPLIVTQEIYSVYRLTKKSCEPATDPPPDVEQPEAEISQRISVERKIERREHIETKVKLK